MTNKIPVGATIAHAYRFFFGNIPALLRATWIPLLLHLAVALVMSRRMALFFAAIDAHDPAAVTLLGSVLLLLCLALILFAAQFAAATEVALGRPPYPLFHVPLGRATWRLLGGFIAAVLAIGAVALAGLVILWIVSALLKLMFHATPGARPIVLTVVALEMTAFFLLFTFASVRLLFLVAPVNVAEQKLGVTQSWELTAGNFWRAFLVTLAIMIPVAAANYALAIAIAGFPPGTQGMSREAAQAVMTAWRTAQLNALADHWYVFLPVTGVVSLFQFGALSAAQVFAWRHLTGSAPVAGDALP